MIGGEHKMSRVRLSPVPRCLHVRHADKNQHTCRNGRTAAEQVFWRWGYKTPLGKRKQGHLWVNQISQNHVLNTARRQNYYTEQGYLHHLPFRPVLQRVGVRYIFISILPTEIKLGYFNMTSRWCSIRSRILWWWSIIYIYTILDLMNVFGILISRVDAKERIYKNNSNDKALNYY